VKVSFTIPARLWNAVIRALIRARPLPGTNCRLQETEWGTVCEFVPPVGWKHPWFTTPHYNSLDGRWEVAIEPGFVAGRGPLVEMVSLDPVTREKHDTTPLLARPSIPVQGRRPIGNDEGDEDPLKFFQALGVRANTPLPSGGGVTVNADAIAASDLPKRYLRAVDFVVAVPRAALRGQISVVDASGTSGQSVDYAVGLDTSRVESLGNRARVRQDLKYSPPREPSLAERLLGVWTDPAEDTHLISTLYVVSPPGETSPGEPDATWSPYVAHELFWNLGHAPRNDVPKSPMLVLRLFTGLAGGIGDLLGNQILSGINDFGQRVENAVSNTTHAGKFWTV